MFDQYRPMKDIIPFLKKGYSQSLHVRQHQISTGKHTYAVQVTQSPSLPTKFLPGKTARCKATSAYNLSGGGGGMMGSNGQPPGDEEALGSPPAAPEPPDPPPGRGQQD